MSGGDVVSDRFRPFLLLGGVFILLAASLGLAIYDQSRRQAEAEAMAEVQARVLAHTVTAALAFGDRAALREYVDALRAGPDIEAVAVYDNAGAALASFDRADRVGAPWEDPGLERGGGRIIAVVPVAQSGVTLGQVCLRHRAEPLGQRIRRYVPAGFLVLMGSLMFLVMTLDAQTLRRANRALENQIAQREKAEAALRQSQKMEAIGRLTGGIAHDFNNMLAIVLGSLDLLLRRYADADPRLLRFAQEAKDGAGRAAALTQRLLAFSRLQPLKPTSADIARTVNDMAGILRRTLGETIAIETVAPDDLWRAFIDLSELETALLNLAINARDAMPGGGLLRIDTGNVYLDRASVEGDPDVAPGDYVMIAMSDTGSGIAPDVLAQVFEPFFTTKPTGKGTGLGLSQVLGFIKQSGGHVRIDSQVGVGTRVRLYLPRSTAEPRTAPPPGPAPAPARALRHETVLVVEDEPGVTAFVTEALAELGYAVLAADRGEVALQILRSRRDIDLLLTDVVMPGIDGPTLADRARLVRRGLRVVYMTGYDRNTIVQNGRLAAGAHLVTKPFTVGQLGAALELALDESRPD